MRLFPRANCTQARIEDNIPGMVNAIMITAFENRSFASLSAISVDRASLKDLSLKSRQQAFYWTVFDNRHQDCSIAR